MNKYELMNEPGKGSFTSPVLMPSVSCVHRQAVCVHAFMHLMCIHAFNGGKWIHSTCMMMHNDILTTKIFVSEIFFLCVMHKNEDKLQSL